MTIRFPLDEGVFIPVSPHPGSFGAVRKHHIHEGVDLYCENGTPVYAMEYGKIVTIQPFTGEIADSPWWNNTWCVMIEGIHTINYGEIIPNCSLRVGDTLSKGSLVGVVERVLKKDKGKPMSMLHIEQYVKGTVTPIREWTLGRDRPECLLDPTELLSESLISSYVRG